MGDVTIMYSTADILLQAVASDEVKYSFAVRVLGRL
jgi:hypothetical protein